VNSYGNEYRDHLIAEICVNDPTYIAVGQGGVQVGQNACSAWIVLGSLKYVGPLGQCYGPVNEPCSHM
jgi:hypothetical protein